MAETSDGHIHIVPAWEPWHVESKDCPCHPQAQPETPRYYTVQRLVYVHKATSEEGN